VGGRVKGVRGKGAEMTQTLYAHMNKKKKFLFQNNIDGMNLIEVYYVHVCKYHNETPLYNYFTLIKYLKIPFSYKKKYKAFILNETS
jgi:hypothetical protein